MNSVSVQTNDSNAGYARALYIIAVASFPVVLAGCITFIVFVTGVVQRADGIGHRTEFAEFEYPVVSDQYELRGTLKSIPKGETVYLAEMLDGRYWPKKVLGDSPKSFTNKQVTSAGDGYKYTVVLLSVGADENDQISRWFAQGLETGRYPGIVDLKDATTLAKIRIVRQ